MYTAKFQICSGCKTNAEILSLERKYTLLHRKHKGTLLQEPIIFYKFYFIVFLYLTNKIVAFFPNFMEFFQYYVVVVTYCMYEKFLYERLRLLNFIPTLKASQRFVQLSIKT